MLQAKKKNLLVDVMNSLFQLYKTFVKVSFTIMNQSVGGFFAAKSKNFFINKKS